MQSLNFWTGSNFIPETLLSIIRLKLSSLNYQELLLPSYENLSNHTFPRSTPASFKSSLITLQLFSMTTADHEPVQQSVSISLRWKILRNFLINWNRSDSQPLMNLSCILGETAEAVSRSGLFENKSIEPVWFMRAHCLICNSSNAHHDSKYRSFSTYKNANSKKCFSHRSTRFWYLCMIGEVVASDRSSPEC